MHASRRRLAAIATPAYTGSCPRKHTGLFHSQVRKRIDRGKKKSKMAKRLVEIRSMVGEVVVVEVVVKVKVVVCSQFVTHGGGKEDGARVKSTQRGKTERSRHMREFG